MSRGIPLSRGQTPKGLIVPPAPPVGPGLAMPPAASAASAAPALSGPRVVHMHRLAVYSL